MAMRKTIPAAILLLVVNIALAQAALAGDYLPFHGSDVGTFDVPGTCGDGSLQVVIAGSGSATHLGRYSYQANECFNPVTGAFSGVPTITAANGDQLFGTYTGQVSPTTTANVVSYNEQLEISGGTGRFSGASGVFEVSGRADLATLEYSQSLAGVISNLGRS